jgi:hypothetical protein
MAHIRLTWLDSSDMTLALSPLLKDFITSIYINYYYSLLLYQSDAEIWIFNKGFRFRFVTTQAFRPSLRINVANEKKWWQKLKNRWNISINFLRFDFFDFFSSWVLVSASCPFKISRNTTLFRKCKRTPFLLHLVEGRFTKVNWISNFGSNVLILFNRPHGACASPSLLYCMV